MHPVDDSDSEGGHKMAEGGEGAEPKTAEPKTPAAPEPMFIGAGDDEAVPAEAPKVPPPQQSMAGVAPPAVPSPAWVPTD
eukprot:2748541-Alexandrium_andersonii.AAC.1